jgi:type II secretory pathway predicted ATPase ExeA
LGTLITALFCDLSTDKEPRIPKQGELRERELRHLVRKRKKPIVLIVDEAHDLHHHTLTGLKRIIEMVADGDGKLSVLLAGHPKLRNDLRNPTMEEIGYRTAVFSLEGVTGSQREYIRWLLGSCAAETTTVDDVLDPAALDLLASRLRTPLQIEQHLTLALETGYQASEKPISEAIIDSVLSKRIDDLEPTLMRHGYSAKVLTELLETRPGEIKALFRQTLEPDRARELTEQMLAAGLPV